MKKAEEFRRACLEVGAKLLLTGHDCADVDSVISCVLLQKLLRWWGIDAQICLESADRQVRRVLPRFGIDADGLCGEIREQDCVVLADHHVPQHACRVIACVDHHPTDYMPDYPFVWIEPCGACAHMALRLMREAGMPVGDEEIRLAVLALYLDTIALRSAKIMPHEAAFARSEAARLGMDINMLEREGLGLRDMTLPARELAMTGKKVYAFDGRTVISTYVQTNEMTDERLEAILEAARAALLLAGADRWVFLHHDPIAMCTTQYDLTPGGGTRVYRYDYLASRGRDVMPRVEREMRMEGGA